jgi:acyl-coenzyme A synthetase/AMP-(fatty) acid ligase
MRAEKQPGEVYMFAPEPQLRLTYSQLKHDSIQLGKYLYKKGLQKGDKISFMLGNGYQTTKIFLGRPNSFFSPLTRKSGWRKRALTSIVLSS